MACDASCCKFAPMTRKEFKLIKRKYGFPAGTICFEIADPQRRVPNNYMVMTDRQSGRCAFLTPEKRCAIYADRPKVCRDYGTSAFPCDRCQPLAANSQCHGRQRIKTILSGGQFHGGTDNDTRDLETDNV